jgi:hypothetical protein
VAVVIEGREKRRWEGKINNPPGLYTPDSIKTPKREDNEPLSI